MREEIKFITKNTKYLNFLNTFQLDIKLNETNTNTGNILDSIKQNIEISLFKDKKEDDFIISSEFYNDKFNIEYSFFDKYNELIKKILITGCRIHNFGIKLESEPLEQDKFFSNRIKNHINITNTINKNIIILHIWYDYYNIDINSNVNKYNNEEYISINFNDFNDQKSIYDLHNFISSKSSSETYLKLTNLITYNTNINFICINFHLHIKYDYLLRQYYKTNVYKISNLDLVMEQIDMNSFHTKEGFNYIDEMNKNNIYRF